MDNFYLFNTWMISICLHLSSELNFHKNLTPSKKIISLNYVNIFLYFKIFILVSSFKNYNKSWIQLKRNKKYNV